MSMLVFWVVMSCGNNSEEHTAHLLRGFQYMLLNNCSEKAGHMIKGVKGNMLYPQQLCSMHITQCFTYFQE
jgi:hypothetical protein